MSPDIYLNITEWMERCAEAIANMPYRAEFYEHDIAIQIAKHLPLVRPGERKWKKLPKLERPPMTDRVNTWIPLYRVRAMAGLCVRCGEPAAEKWGRKLRLCQEHREADVKRSRYVRKTA